MGKFIDLTNKKFGRLKVIERGKNSKHNQIQWKCICECGKEILVLGSHLKSGHTKSCGCYQREKTSEYCKNNVKNYGEKKTRLYRIWQAMKTRCYNSNAINYKNYGGRGIIICDTWLNDFQAFKNWAINNGYNDNLTIDRIDTNGIYEPSNCRWSTYETQNNNQRDNHYIYYKGDKKTLTQWARELKMKRGTLSSRINSYKWNIDKAFKTKSK